MCAGQAAAGYESRDVFVTSLPDLFLDNLSKRDAATLYEEWLEAEIIIGCKPKRGSNNSLVKSTSRWWW